MGVVPHQGTGRAKLLVLGEHAAVYGHPAVGFTLPWTLTAALEPGSARERPSLGPHTEAVQALVHRLETLALQRGWSRPEVGRLSFSSSIPIGSGFGSSGALCAALVNLFWPRQPLADRDRLAWEAEAQFHGTPSGIDTALALREGWWALDTGTKPVTATDLPPPRLTLVTGAVVRASDTKSLVAALARRHSAGDPEAVRRIEALGSLAAQAVEGLQNQGGAGLASLVDGARDHLAALGLESPELTTVLEAGLGCPGAEAGKLSGAGGGGAFFLLFSDPERAEAALEPMIRAVPQAAWACLPQVVSSGPP